MQLKAKHMVLPRQTICVFSIDLPFFGEGGRHGVSNLAHPNVEPQQSDYNYSEYYTYCKYVLIWKLAKSPRCVYIAGSLVYEYYYRISNYYLIVQYHLSMTHLLHIV